jgi:hypothetical protein
MKVLDTYMKEVEADTKLDVFSAKDVQSKLPGIKHKWVGRLMRHKQNVISLERSLKSKKSNLLKQVKEEAPYKVSTPVAAKAIEDQPSVIDIREQIADEKLVIAFLEKVERIFSSMTFDIKNLTEIMKLETM